MYTCIFLKIGLYTNAIGKFESMFNFEVNEYKFNSKISFVKQRLFFVELVKIYLEN